MADAIVRFKVESQEYENKLARATQQLQHMEKEVRRTGASFDAVDKEELAFIQSLGQMETKTQSVRSKMREYTESILSLSEMYERLSDTEKNSDFGKAMLSSMQQLKQRAGELKDNMGDLDEELKHMASDTQFTDGVNLMTSTIGSCAAAMTAWTADSKELEQVIRELAKITTTVKAVQDLTNAFQKQNMVLLKNPYVLAATAAAAIAVAIGKIIKSSSELSAVQKTLNEVEKKGREGAAEEITRINSLNSILHDNTRSLEERKSALVEIQNLVPDYHGSLTDEGTLIDNNTTALDNYISGLQRAATAQAAFDKMVELQKKKMDQMADLQQKQNELAVANSRREQAQGSVIYAGSEMSVTYEQIDVRGAKRAVQDAEAAVRATDAEIQALQNLVKATDIATGTNTGGGKLKVDDVLPEGSIAQVKARISELNKAYEMAGDATTRDIIRSQIKALKDELEMMNADLTRIDSNIIPLEVELAPTAIEVITKEMDGLRKRLGLEPIQLGVQVGTDGKGTVETAKQTEKAWGSVANAISAVGGALQGLEDPSAKVAGIIAQAIANIALTFAASLKGTVTPWDWIAAAISGTATMIGTIAAIKSATSGSYANGGIIPGNNFSGDNLTASVNSGELILNRAQQANIASQLTGNPMDNLELSVKLTGEDLYICLENNNRRRGRR